MVSRADVIRVLRNARGKRIGAVGVCTALNLPISDTGEGWQNFCRVARILSQIVSQSIADCEFPKSGETEWATYAIPVPREELAHG